MTEKTIYQQISEAIGAGDSTIIPEIIKMLADKNEAKVLLAASPPATVEEISQKTNIQKEEVEKMMDRFYQLNNECRNFKTIEK